MTGIKENRKEKNAHAKNKQTEKTCRLVAEREGQTYE